METASAHHSSRGLCPAKSKAPVSPLARSGLIILDSERRVTGLSRAAVSLLGLPPAAYMGQPLESLLAMATHLPPSSVAQLRHIGAVEGGDILCPLPETAESGLALEAHMRGLDIGQKAITIQQAGLGRPASADRLSGLLDRLGFIDAVKTMVPAQDATHVLAVFSIDLERFSWVNDIYGHAQGDAVLRQIAGRILGSIGESDRVARMHGSAFLVAAWVKPGAAAAAAYANNLLAALNEPCQLEGQPVLVKPVIGAALSPDHGRDAYALLRAAGLAMRQAGQESVPIRIFQPAMLDKANRCKMLEGDLRLALQRQEFELYYQPQFATGNGSLMGFEALLRWNHPERGQIMPGDFIPLAEELGLITELGNWVLQAACRQAAEWPAPLYVSVNVSGLQFEQGGLVDAVRDALDRAGLPGSRLEVEITETALLRQSDEVMHTLTALRALSVRISMDDFGTGYSSLTQLHQFPFDKLKIDRSFVSRIGRGAEGLAIIRAIARMGASLGLRTVAEGVETLEQWDLLRAEGCDEAQGYMLGRPTPASKLGPFLGHMPPLQTV